MYNVICYHSIREFLINLKKFDVCENPYESYSFMSVFLKYFPKGNFYFFDIYDDDKKIGIIPFECTFESSVLKIKKFRFIGYREFNYEQYICKEKDTEKVHNILLNYFDKQNYAVAINYYDINNASKLYDILDKSELIKSEYKLYVCPVLHFNDNFDDFFKTVFTTSKKRSELKKFHKRLADLGNFRLVNVDDETSYYENKKYIDQVYRVHAERFSNVYSTSFFGSPSMKPYYSKLIESLMKGKKGFISLLLMDETVIAFIFCLTNGKVLIDWIPAFDPAYSKYSLGIVQYKMLFEELCNNSEYESFDYSKGASVYKSKWAKEETVNYQFLINLNPKSYVSSLLFGFCKFKYSFKLYLRNKGILSKGKKVLGLILSIMKKKDLRKDNIDIVYVKENSDSESLYTFKYSDIVSLPLSYREEVLSSIYKGGIVKSINKYEDNVKIIILNKQ